MAQRNALAERALAYFETDQLALAIQDYKSVKALTIRPQCPLIIPLKNGGDVSGIHRMEPKSAEPENASTFSDTPEREAASSSEEGAAETSGVFDAPEMGQAYIPEHKIEFSRGLITSEQQLG